MRPIAAALAAITLAGCASPYVPPASGPVARILFVNHARKNLLISYFDESRNCVGRRRTEVIQGGAEREHVVRAGEELTFQFFLTEYHFDGGLRQTYCAVNLRFVPKAGNAYVLRAFEAQADCRLDMVDVTLGGTGVAEPLQAIPWEKGWTEGSSWCDG